VSGAVRLQPTFLPSARGRLFATLFGAEPRSERAVLLLPPFAEEMNKCRPMLAAQARMLAQLGTDVLILDLSGTGDSEGEFADARWEGWLEDLLTAHGWLRGRGATCIDLWAVRGGALFVAGLAGAVVASESHLLLWHPFATGRQLATQLLRLRIAADAARGGPQTADALRAQLRERGSIEIAGYEIAQPLLDALEKQTLQAGLVQPWKSVMWLDVLAAPSTEPLPGTARLLEAARTVPVQHSNVVGEPFWGTPEIARIPALLEATSRMYRAAAGRI
jgi:exosortase A-associated hydrolase 2